MLKNYAVLLPFDVRMLFLSFIFLFSSGTYVIGQTQTQQKGNEIVFLVSTPNMKITGKDRSDYDRVKMALAKEFNSSVRGFYESKLAFSIYTYSDDKSKVAKIREQIVKVIPDAKIESITFDELKKIVR